MVILDSGSEKIWARRLLPSATSRLPYPSCITVSNLVALWRC